ncbi:MAG: HAMP domain-containing histidine kinase [Gracilibacteraceae bacterium]|nr:HAMP domain-containing histidine kinase [Gracilibacteraceae bacterium]
MLIDKRQIVKLSADIRRVIDGQDVDFRDNREGVFSILKNDIHTLARLKNEQVDALKRDKAALKDAIADISHQLKTPYTSMMIMADLLENAPPAKQAEFIAGIRTELARTEWLVAALLKMARLDAGVVEFGRRPVRAEVLVALALEPLQILLDVKNQTVTASGTAEFICDEGWTAEALTNVLKNASEHSPAGGAIRVQSGENPICAWISVTDSGAGISNAEIAKLFKRFEGSRGGGYGIGLPLARAVMRGQNGDVQIDGKNGGGGATFTLKLFK